MDALIKIKDMSDRYRNVMFHYAGPHSAQMKEWNIGKIRYFVPIKIKEGH